MDLNPNNKTAPLLEEYIHQQLDWKIEHFRAAGNRCLPTESASAMGLREARGRHYDRLVNEFTADVIDPWMSRNLLKSQGKQSDILAIISKWDAMAPELEYYGTAGLQRWLASSDRDPKQFVRWLQDYDIPGDREGREPHEWLLEQLGVGTSRAENEGRMAEALAEFIESEPDRSPPGDDPDQLMYNLFHLAAGLRRPRILGKPLLAIYRRRSPTGAYLQISHLRSLQEALAENQIDSSLKEEWMKLIRDETYSPLDADRGFESILRMPESEETLGRVNREAIGEALKWMAIRMEDYERSDRAQQFSLLIRRVKSYYSLSFDVLTDYVLFRLSVRFDWPPWACEYVPIPSEHLVRLRNGGGVVPPPMLFLDFPLEMIKALLSLQWPADITTQPVEALFVHEALIVLVERGVDRVGASHSRSAQVGDIVEILIVLRGVAKLKGDWVLYAATIHAQREIAFVGMGDLASEFRRAHMPSEIIECLEQPLPVTNLAPTDPSRLRFAQP